MQNLFQIWKYLFQAMIIIGWSSLGPVGVFFDKDVFRNVMTIFITYAFLNFLQGTLFLCYYYYCSGLCYDFINVE